MIITKPLLGSIRICSPYDPAIDAEAWTTAPEDYLLDVVRSDVEVPLPPVKAGERLTVIEIAPLDYSAHVRAEHMIERIEGDWPLTGEVQEHVLRHGIVGIENAYTEVDGEQVPVRVRREEGPTGRRLTAEAWRSISPFADRYTWAMLTMACATRSRRAHGGTRG